MVVIKWADILNGHTLNMVMIKWADTKCCND